MARKRLPDPELVRECLNYNPDTGGFTWRKRPPEHFPDRRSHTVYNARYAGKAAGYANLRNGYVHIRLRLKGRGGLFQASRLAWLLVHGKPIPVEIDHVDGNPANNRISNLRAAQRSTNAANTRRRKDNTTGAKGVSFCKQTGRYRVIISKNGKHYRLGRFDTIEEAAAARRQAAIQLHGEFARHE